MSEITDKDLSSIYSSLSLCSPTVRGLAERLRRVEEEQLLSGVCEVCTSKVLVENTALRERMKRMEEALQKIVHGEYEFVKYHCRRVAAEALEERP